MIDQVHGLFKQLRSGAAVHEKCLCPEHFRHFRKDGGSALAHQQIGKRPHHRIGRDAGQSVGSAALHADDQLGGIYLLPGKCACVSCQLLKKPHGSLHLILHILALEKLHTVLVVRSDVVHEYGNVAVLTSQSQHQNASRVGMADHICQHLSGILLVITHLGTSVRVGKCNHVLHISNSQ